MIACLFLLSWTSGYAIDNFWIFDTNLQTPYNLILNLQTDEAYGLLNRPGTKVNELQRIYLLSFCETIDILITEDEKNPPHSPRREHLPHSSMYSFFQSLID